MVSKELEGRKGKGSNGRAHTREVSSAVSSRKPRGCRRLASGDEDSTTYTDDRTAKSFSPPVHRGPAAPSVGVGDVGAVQAAGDPRPRDRLRELVTRPRGRRSSSRPHAAQRVRVAARHHADRRPGAPRGQSSNLLTRYYAPHHPPVADSRAGTLSSSRRYRSSGTPHKEVQQVIQSEEGVGSASRAMTSRTFRRAAQLAVERLVIPYNRRCTDVTVGQAAATLLRRRSRRQIWIIVQQSSRRRSSRDR